MSCRDKIMHLIRLGNLGGEDVVNQPRQNMITYKYLRLTKARQFQSPLSDAKWDGGVMGGKAVDEKSITDWVWSCTTPDNPELARYHQPDHVLVTLQVWGKVIVMDNGVVQSQSARIIDYDMDDYYLASYFLDLISFEEAKKSIGEDNARYQELLLLLVIKSPESGFGGQRVRACYSCEDAYYFAKDVERAPHPVTRYVACRHPEFAYLYARNVDKGPRDDTREAACNDPYMAYQYAVDVDRSFHPKTYLAVQKHAELAKKYRRMFRADIEKYLKSQKKSKFRLFG